jgi:hypothetical protein
MSDVVAINKDFKALLYNAMELGSGGFWYIYVRRAAILSCLERLLERFPNKVQKLFFAFYKRIFRKKKSLFTFLFIENIPPNNTRGIG